MKRNAVKKILILQMTCMAIFLTACKGSSSKKSEVVSNKEMSATELQLIQFALEPYAIGDSLSIRELSDPLDLFAISGTKEFFRSNQKAILDKTTQAKTLHDQGKYKELMSLLSNNLESFHAHPLNSLPNEIKLHRALIILFDRYMKSTESLPKKIRLQEYTLSHIHALDGKRSVPVTSIIPQADSLASFYLLQKEDMKAVELIHGMLIMVEEKEGTSSKLYPQMLEKAVQVSRQAGQDELSKEYQNELDKWRKTN